MPKFNHADLGEILSYRYRDAVIEEIFYPVERTQEERWDYAKVRLNHDGSVGIIPIYYHCESATSLRENGAIVNSSQAFEVGDKVIVRTEVHSDREDAIHVVGFVDGARKCRCCVGDVPKTISAWTFGDDLIAPVACEDLESLRLALQERVINVDGTWSNDLETLLSPRLLAEDGVEWTRNFDSILLGIIDEYVNHTTTEWAEWMWTDQIEAWSLKAILSHLGESLFSFTDCPNLYLWARQRRKILRLLLYPLGDYDVFDWYVHRYACNDAGSVGAYYKAIHGAMDDIIKSVSKPANWETDWKNIDGCWEQVLGELRANGEWNGIEGDSWGGVFGFSGGARGQHSHKMTPPSQTVSYIIGFKYNFQSWLSGSRYALKLMGKERPFSYQVHLSEELVDGKRTGGTGVGGRVFTVANDTAGQEVVYEMYNELSKPSTPQFHSYTGLSDELIFPEVGDSGALYADWGGVFRYDSIDSLFEIEVTARVKVHVERARYVFD